MTVLCRGLKLQLQKAQAACERSTLLLECYESQQSVESILGS